jgi:hypothetical protein
MAFGDLNKLIIGLFENVRESLLDKPQLLPVQNRRLIGRLREFSRVSGDDKLRLFALHMYLLFLPIERYATLLLRKRIEGEEFRKNLLKAELSEGEVAIILKAVRDLDIVTVTDFNGEVDVEEIIAEISEELKMIDEKRRSKAFAEIIRFIHDSLPLVCSEVQRKVDEVLKDIIKSLYKDWNSVHECIESYLLEFDKMVEKLGGS